MRKRGLPEKKLKLLVRNLRYWRKRRHFTPTEASIGLRKTRTYISALEGSAFTPSLVALQEIAKLYNCKLADLVREM